MNEVKQLLSDAVAEFSYCPGPETQHVSIGVSYEDEILTKALTVMLERNLRHIDYGLGAGSLFPPFFGTQRIIKKPDQDVSSSAAYLVEVSSVAPEYWISIAHLLSIGFVSISNHYSKSRAVTIAGDISGKQQTYDKSWLLGVCDDSRFPFFEPVPFIWKQDNDDCDDSSRLLVAVELDRRISETLIEQYKNFIDAVLGHLSYAMPHDVFPEVKGEQHEMTAFLEDVLCPAELLLSSLLNALHCFHEKIGRIKSVRISW